MVYEELFINDLDTELNNIINGKKIRNNDFNDIKYDIVSLNSVKDYLRLISKYPLLSDEELLFYGKNLKLINNLTIVKKNNKNISEYGFDCSKVLVNLTKTNFYDTILKLLIKNLKNIKNKNDMELIYLLKKYQKLCSEKKSNLSDIDLRDHFCIDVNEIIPIEKKEFLNEIKQYFLYWQAREIFINSNLRLELINISRD